MQSLSEDQTNRAYRLFYGEGMNLGQVAETLGCGLYALTPWLTAPSLRIAEQAITDSKTEKADAYAKLDDDSLDAIMEVIGSPRLYSSGKSAMRQWFLRRLRLLWNLSEPPSEEALKRTPEEAAAHVDAANAHWHETEAVCDDRAVLRLFGSVEFDCLDNDGKEWLAAVVEVAQRRACEQMAKEVGAATEAARGQ